MTPERWQQIKALFDETLDQPPTERTTYLRQACPDSEVYQEVAMLVAAAAEGDLLAPPPGLLPGLSSDLLAEGTLLKERYQVGRKIGEGGFAQVFVATDRNVHDRRVVIKALRRGQEPAPLDADEARALATIDHPGVVGVFDTGTTDDGLAYLVMQFVEGQTLRSLTADALPNDRVLGIVTQLAQAIDAAHGAGVIHQDIKPENVMVQLLPNRRDRVRLIDFGIAQVRAQSATTDSIPVVGSPSYMSPEQLLGHACAASDIFALAVVAYEMFTGARPFPAYNPVELYDCQQNGRFQRPRHFRPDLPAAAEQAIVKALAYSPDDRFASAEEFARELSSAFEVMPSEESEVREPATTSKEHRFDLFISYASLDSAFVGRWIDELERRGWRCTDGLSGAPPGTIDQASCFVLAMTVDADRSARVLEEAKAAAIAGKAVIVLSIDSVWPTNLLEFVLPQPVRVDCPSSPSRADYDRVESALRRVASPSGGPRKLSKRQMAPEPRAPLLTDKGARILFGSGFLRTVAVAAAWAAVTCVLAILGHAADITVLLAAPSNPAPLALRFGYLYELNSAFLYVFIVPLVVYCALQFVQQTQVALVALASCDQLVAKGQEGVPAGGPLAAVGDANRRWFSPGLFAFALGVTVFLMAGTEYLPPKSDYKNLMFGYVQAPWIADYPLVCPQCTLRDLSLKTGRRLETTGGVSDDVLASYKIVPPYYRRGGGIVERVSFALFIVSALSLEIAFGVFLIWIVLKVLFVLQLLYRALDPPKRFPLQIYLRFTDPKGLFGLEPVHRVLARVVGLIGISGLIQLLAGWANLLKGSKRMLGGDLSRLGGWGQFFVTNYCILLAFMLLLYLFLLTTRTRELAADECALLKELGAARKGDRKTSLQDILPVVDGQNIWSHSRYTAMYVLAPVLYLASLIAFTQLDIARKVGWVWDLFLRHLLGRA
jgi:serine/threonine protein kinase